MHRPKLVSKGAIKDTKCFTGDSNIWAIQQYSYSPMMCLIVTKEPLEKEKYLFVNEISIDVKPDLLYKRFLCKIVLIVDHV